MAQDPSNTTVQVANMTWRFPLEQQLEVRQDMTPTAYVWAAELSY